jgi:D-tyrosyl-tRNA(Tyr) deacylase
MRIVIQRVSRAEVRVDGRTIGRIGKGLVLLVAIEKEDIPPDLDWVSAKVLQMRVFEDNSGKMNLSVADVGADILVVSQFTLAADLGRGRRPSFENAAPPERAQQLFESFVDRLVDSGLKIETGRFRAFMEVELVNDGPVTFTLERRRR